MGQSQQASSQLNKFSNCLSNINRRLGSNNLSSSSQNLYLRRSNDCMLVMNPTNEKPKMRRSYSWEILKLSGVSPSSRNQIRRIIHSQERTTKMRKNQSMRTLMYANVDSDLLGLNQIEGRSQDHPVSRQFSNPFGGLINNEDASSVNKTSNTQNHRYDCFSDFVYVREKDIGSRWTKMRH